MRNLFRVLNLLLVAVAVNTLLGCAKETDEDKIGDTQFCLDDVPISGLTAAQRSSQINSCLEKMDGVTTKQANLIRCASGFMIEGFADPAKLVQIAEQLDSSTGQDPTTALMSILVFKSQGSSDSTTDQEDKNFAQSTFNSCNETGSTGYLMISSVANMATVIASFTGGNFSTGLDQLIANLSGSGGASATELANASAEVIGATAVAAYQTSCTNGNNTNTEICSQLGTAITSNSGNMSAIGNSLLQDWKTP